MSPEEANRYGFDWPEGIGPHVQVTRASTIDRGKRGTWRVLTVKTAREELAIYVTPTGKMRVFRKGGGELVARAPSD